jgi:hypothetical protein
MNFGQTSLRSGVVLVIRVLLLVSLGFAQCDPVQCQTGRIGVSAK